MVLFCIKHLDPEKYAGLTGLRQLGALRFARELQEHNIPFWLRYVLIPGHTDDADGIKHLADFAHQHEPAVQVCDWNAWGPVVCAVAVVCCRMTAMVS
jgi:pyruvate-formate lyase-activating enzyme